MAGKSAGFAIGVGINDAASAGLDAINKRIAALTAPADRFNKSLAKFGDVTGINRAAEGMQTLEMSLIALMNAGTITYDSALETSMYPKDLARAVA